MEHTSTAPMARSLVEQVRRFSPPAEQTPELPGSAALAELAAEEAGCLLADGCRRISPVQAYRVPEWYRKRRRLLLILSALLLAAVTAAAIFFLPRLFHGFQKA